MTNHMFTLFCVTMVKLGEARINNHLDVSILIKGTLIFFSDVSILIQRAIIFLQTSLPSCREQGCIFRHLYLHVENSMIFFRGLYPHVDTVLYFQTSLSSQTEKCMFSGIFILRDFLYFLSDDSILIERTNLFFQTSLSSHREQRYFFGNLCNHVENRVVLSEVTILVQRTMLFFISILKQRTRFPLSVSW